MPTKTRLSFIEQPSDKITWWKVTANNGTIGIVRYFNHWRKYVFEPGPYTIFDESCMLEIIEFLKWENGKRKETLLRKKLK